MIEKVPKLYLDTSVFGGFYDIEFEEETQILFEKINLSQFKVVFLIRLKKNYLELLKMFKH
jgi:hypothetical protein